MSDVVIIDNPINRMSIDQLTLEQFDAHLAHIREERIKYVQRAKENSITVGAHVPGVTREKYDKHVAAVQKMLTKADAEHEKIAAAITKLRIMTIEVQ